jgi:prevent-host-death family protein
MNSIPAKELRLNLKETLEKVSNGESYIVIYNSKPIAKLSPLSEFPEKKRGNGREIAKVLRKISRKTEYSDDPRSIKEIYHDLLMKDQENLYKPGTKKEK